MHIIRDVVETEIWGKLRDRDFIKKSETEIRDLKICGFCRIFSKNFQKNVTITSKLKFFRFSSIFPTCFCVSYLQTQTKNTPNYNSFLSHIVAVLKASTQCLGSRSDIFETETRKNGS